MLPKTSHESTSTDLSGNLFVHLRILATVKNKAGTKIWYSDYSLQIIVIAKGEGKSAILVDAASSFHGSQESRKEFCLFDLFCKLNAIQ